MKIAAFDEWSTQNEPPPAQSADNYGDARPSPFDAEPATDGVSLNDFRAYMPAHSYIYTPSREPWPASSVNARVPPVPVFDAHGQPVLGKDGGQKTISASDWLDRNHPVEQMTWAAGLPMLVHNRLISDGGWIERGGVTCFNLYRPPTMQLGDGSLAGPWLEHVRRVFADEADHIVKWLAQRVQCPEDKINHALVLGGHQGIGKDSLLEPVSLPPVIECEDVTP